MNYLPIIVAFLITPPFAFADSKPAPSATAPAKSNTKIKMRIHVDPFYKNINDTSKNYKIPKLESLRLLVSHDFGKNSRADIGIFLHDLESRENSRKDVWYRSKNSDGKVLVNTNTLRHFSFVFKIPLVEGLQIGYVRELEPALYGYTDRPKSSLITESPSFTGHMSRVEGFRTSYQIDQQNKLTYHIARNADQNEYTLGTKPTNTTWYHRLTSNNSLANTSVETGAGIQGKWLSLDDSHKMKYDYFLHIVAKQRMDNLKIKGGIACDNYAVTTIDSDKKNEPARATATTFLIAAKYDFLPREFVLISELGYRSLLLPREGFIDFTSANRSLVRSATETSFVAAGQYFLDEKLSLIPSYTYYSSNRAHLNSNNMTGNALLGERKMLETGVERKPTKSEHALGLRIYYEY